MDSPKLTMVPRSSKAISILLVAASCVTSATLGFDGSMMNGLNILPSYTDYFHLTTTTLALNTASVWLGGCIAGFFYGIVTDAIGRKNALLVGALVTILGVVLQTASQNIAMFVLGRIIIGFGTSANGSAGPTYLAETLPAAWRAWGLAVFYDFWLVGGLLAAGVTYGTAQMESTWAWRLPSALQGLFSLLCIILLPFLPESPRWLVHQGRHDEALDIVALTHADGDRDDHVVLVQFKEIVDTLTYEVENEQTLSLMQTVRTPSARRRLGLAVSVAVCTMLSGNNIISFYLGSMLGNAGITDSTTQLEINIILNAWCLVICLIGTSMVDKIGRKTLAIWSTIPMTICIFLIGGLTSAFGESTNTAGIYGTVAAIFIFQGSYSFGWTPLTVLYPPEVLNFPIRANGMAINGFFANAVGLMVTFAFPYALEAISWKTYVINGAWDVLELVFVVVCWVETGGRTLEEIDEIFDGVKHSDAPDLEDVINGKADLSNLVVEGVEASGKSASVGEKRVATKVDEVAMND